jgi:hypothetical protein
MVLDQTVRRCNELAKEFQAAGDERTAAVLLQRALHWLNECAEVANPTLRQMTLESLDRLHNPYVPVVLGEKAVHSSGWCLHLCPMQWTSTRAVAVLTTQANR